MRLQYYVFQPFCVFFFKIEISSNNEQTEPLENTPGDEPEKPDFNETLVERNQFKYGRHDIFLRGLVESSFNRPNGHAETTRTGLAINDMPTRNIVTGSIGRTLNVSTGHIESTDQGMLSTSNQSSEQNSSEPPAKSTREDEKGDDEASA